MHQPIDTNKGQPHEQSSGLAGMPDLSEILPGGVQDVVNRAQAFCKANPAVAILGVTSIAALAFLAMRPAAKPERTYARLDRQIRKTLADQRRNGSDFADGISKLISTAATVDPKQLTPYKEMAEDWLTKARDQVGAFVKR